MKDIHHLNMKNRSQEEIDAILQTFPDVFEDLTGKKLTKEQVSEVITEILKLKERDIIKQRFLDFSPFNLREILKSLNKEETEQKDDINAQIKKVVDKVKKSKK
jgi:DNA-directed RNA polymerase subunit F